MSPKPHDIDHLVLAVRDLDKARSVYTRLGFSLTPKMTGPSGIVSSLAKAGSGYIQLLSADDATALPATGAGEFSFAAFNLDFLEAREGLSMIGLGSEDAEADRAAFDVAGLAAYGPYQVERLLNAVEQQSSRYAQTFLLDPRVNGRAAFFTCQPVKDDDGLRALPASPNGAEHIASTIFVTRDPADFHEFLTHFTGQRDMLSTSLRVSFDLGQSNLEVHSPISFKAFFGENHGVDPRRFLGFSVRVGDLSHVGDLLRANDVPFTEIAGSLVVPSSFALGASIAFTRA